MPAVAKPGGDGVAQFGGFQTHQRRFIGRRDDDDRLCQPVRAQRVVDKLFHFAPAFPNQPNHHDIGFGLAGDHPQQHAFPDAAACH